MVDIVIRQVKESTYARKVYSQEIIALNKHQYFDPMTGELIINNKYHEKFYKYQLTDQVNEI